jgi:drug/metabolite transporter (DMT)-like permease
VLLSAAAFGVMPIFAKLAYEQIDAPDSAQVKTVLAVRFCIAAVLMWGLWLVQRQRSPGANEIAIRPGILLPLVALGALGYVGQSFAYFTAISIISASATGLLLYTYPILVTLLAWLFFREPLTGRKLAALALATLGALMVLGVLSSILGLSESSLGTLSPEGAAWAVAAALIYSIYIIAGARFTRNVPPIFASAVIITSAACVYVIWGLLVGDLRLDMSPAGWFWGSAIAVVSTVVAIVAFFAGLRLVGPSRAAIVSTVEPAVTVLLAALILLEKVSPEQLAGGLLVLASVLILQWRSAPG